MSPLPRSLLLVLSISAFAVLLCESMPMVVKTGGKRKDSDIIILPSHSKCGTPSVIKQGGKKKGDMILLGHEQECHEETHHVPIPYPVHHKKHYEKPKETVQYMAPIMMHGGYGGYGGHGYGHSGYDHGGYEHGEYGMQHDQPSGYGHMGYGGYDFGGYGQSYYGRR